MGRQATIFSIHDLKTRAVIFKNMGGNIPGGNLMGGNFPGGSFPDTTENIFVEDHFFFNFKNFLFKNVHRGQSSKIEM